MSTLYEQGRTPILNVLPALSERDLPDWYGQKIVFDTSWMPGSVSLEGGYTYRPHQSWQNTSYGPAEGIGMYLTMEDGSWHVNLFAFNEATKPAVDQYDFWAWDQQVFGPTGGREDHFIGKLQFANDTACSSLYIRTLDKLRGTEPAYRGDDITISTGAVRNNRKVTIGEGTARVPGRSASPDSNDNAPF